MLYLHRHEGRLARRLAGYCLAALTILTGDPVAAQQLLTVENGKSITLPQSSEVETVFISDTSVADARVSPGDRVFVFGKSVGETSLIATHLDSGTETAYRIVVTHRLSEIRSVLNARFPGEQIAVESSRGSLMVTGLVSDERTRATVIETLRSATPDSSIIDRLTVGGSNVIRLRVVLLEVSRNEAENFGIDWSATVADNGFFIGADSRGVLRLGTAEDDAESSLSAAVDLLVSSGIATIVQETVLSTVTGEQAQFSVGGEIPVPSFITEGEDSEAGNFQLDYKFIGTALDFTPTIADGNKLRLLIDSTISSDTGNVSTVNGNTFPTLSSRSFRTNVELTDGQPFVIAGVSRNNSIGDLRRSRGPGLSRGVDTVFGTDRVTSSSQELVIIVTPLLEDDTRLSVQERLPSPTSNLEYILSGAPLGKGLGTPELGRIAAGFKY